MTKTEEWLNQYRSSKKLNPYKAHTICITGGKGGVGKTSVALKLALELSKSSKVLLIDCDYNMGNSAIRLGINLKNNFHEFVLGRKKLEDCIFKRNNFHLLPGSNANLELFNNNIGIDRVFLNILHDVEKKYDYVLLDCPPGLSNDILCLNAYCDSRFMIATPDRASITDCYGLIKVLKESYGVNENHLIVNMTRDKSEYRKVVKTISETVEKFLGCRTIILGAIKKEEISTEEFEYLLLNKENSSLQKNVVKILGRFSDADCRKPQLQELSSLEGGL